MDFRKTLVKVTGILAGLLVLVLIGLMVYQHQLIKKISMENETTGEAEENGTENDGAEDARAEKENLIKQRIELQKKILEDPSIRESLRSALVAQYQHLFEELDLSPEQQERMKTILANSAMEYLELNPEILTAVTDTEKAALQGRYDYLRKETQFRVEALLGHDNYKKYRSYEDRAFSRAVVSGFAESLASGDGLTEDRQKALVEIMFEEAQKVYADVGYDPTTRLEFPSDMDPKTVSKKMEITDRVLFNSVDGSKGILSESQLNAYNEYLRSYSESVEMSLIMMHPQYGE